MKSKVTTMKERTMWVQGATKNNAVVDKLTQEPQGLTSATKTVLYDN